MLNCDLQMSLKRVGGEKNLRLQIFVREPLQAAGSRRLFWKISRSESESDKFVDLDKKKYD